MVYEIAFFITPSVVASENSGQLASKIGPREAILPHAFRIPSHGMHPQAADHIGRLS